MHTLMYMLAVLVVVVLVTLCILCEEHTDRETEEPGAIKMK